MNAAFARSQSDMIATAAIMAYRVHQDQTGKDGLPYILHPLQVMRTVDLEGLNDVMAAQTCAAALLHDAVEDAGTPEMREEAIKTIDELGLGRVIAYLTRVDDIDYQTYVKTLKTAHGLDADIARRVKIADLEHNMDVRRLPAVTNSDELEKRVKRMAKYTRAHALLKAKQDQGELE